MMIKKRVGYGWLYNWFAVDDARGLAPEGWNVISDTGWTYITDYLIDNYGYTNLNVGGALKSTRNEWLSSNVAAADQFGFAALPGGERSATDGSSANIRHIGLWWSTTEHSSSTATAWMRYMTRIDGMVIRQHLNKPRGFSVRCSSLVQPGDQDGDTGTLTDIDGNIYKWVVIGDKRWMAENLRTTRYRDGRTIPDITDNTDWANLTTGARCAYDNDRYLVYPPKRKYEAFGFDVNVPLLGNHTVTPRPVFPFRLVGIQFWALNHGTFIGFCEVYIDGGQGIGGTPLSIEHVAGDGYVSGGTMFFGTDTTIGFTEDYIIRADNDLVIYIDDVDDITATDPIIFSIIIQPLG